MSNGRSSVLALMMMIPVVLLVTGCLPRAPQRTELMRKAMATEQTIADLRLDSHAYADRFAAVVETAADEIIDRTEDPAVQRNALLWKINAIPACHRAIFQYDPLAALVDAWALTLQMQDFFETGPGRDAFGDQQSIALEAIEGLIAEAHELSRKLEFTESWTESVDKNLFQWVAEHPLESLAFNRASPTPDIALLVPESKRGVGAVMGSLDEGIADLADRSAIYLRHLPQQVQWQGQLVVDELLDDPRVGGPLAALEGLDDSLARTNATLEQLPDTVIGEIDPLFDRLGEERAILTAFFHRQRVETLGFLRAERVALAGVLRAEREATLAMLREERVDTLERLEALTEATRDRSFQSLGGLIDRVLLRGTLYVGALLVVLGVLALAGLRILGFGR